MKIVRTVEELRRVLRELRTERAAGIGAGVDSATGSVLASVGLVPTMGALHEGHLSLVRAARADNDIVVMSIFVNPTQFTVAADLASYPRQEAEDAALAEGAGVDVIFAPDAAELYPEGFATTVSLRGTLVETLEGASRGASHFDGVATIVSKLFIAVMPERAYFGHKDAQQLAVVQRMVADLGLPVEVIGCPTEREADGLARSSRNTRLDPLAREQAAAIPRALETAAQRVTVAAADLAGLEAELTAQLETAGLVVEYVAFVDPESFARLAAATTEVLCAIAARAGDVRLIDNQVLNVGD